MFVEVKCYNNSKTTINTENICRFEPNEFSDDSKMTMIYFVDGNSVLADVPYEKFYHIMQNVLYENFLPHYAGNSLREQQW